MISKSPLTMRLNASTALSTPKILLVPYESHHVPTYHKWMQDPSLQAATASDPLSLEEEFSMQRSWRDDCDKLTFIACLPCSSSPPSGTVPGSASASAPAHRDRDSGRDDDDGEVVERGIQDADDRMVGDVNLFLFPEEREDDEVDRNDQPQAPAGIPSPQRTPGTRLVGELELMIARQDQQGKGLGRAALAAFTWYILSHWTQIALEYAQGSSGWEVHDAPPELAYLRVRINRENARSLKLFGSVGFERVGEANFFGEVELRKKKAGLDCLAGVKGFEGLPAVLRYGKADGQLKQ